MRGVLIVAVLAGCGAEPSEIVVHTGRPFLAAIDRGDGWEVLPDQEDVVLEVDGPFALASACGEVGITQVDVRLATLADGAEWTMPCRQVGGTYHDVEIRMATGAMGESRVAFGDVWLMLENDFPQRVELLEGVSDRLAVEHNAPYRFVLERAVAIDAPGEWVIDLGRDGRPRDPIEIVTNLDPVDAEGRLSTPVRIWTDGAFLELPDFDPDPAISHVLPADVLVDTDEQRIYAIYDYSYTQQSWTSDRVGPGIFGAALPELIDDFTFATRSGVPAVSYVDDRAWPYRRLFAQSRAITGPPRYWTLTALDGWTETAGEDGALAFPDVTTIPGWQPAWEMPSEYLGELDLATGLDEAVISGVELGGVSSP